MAPQRDVAKQEQFLLKRLEKKRKLFGFLRRHRHEIFDDEFQAELEAMDRGTGAGKEQVPPAQMAMALLLQGYLGLSDWDAVEAAVKDLRWQMVLGCLCAAEPTFSQGAFPVLVLAGTDDRYTTLQESRDLFAHAREPKELWEVDGAAHVDLHGFARAEYERRVGAFLAHHLRRVVDGGS